MTLLYKTVGVLVSGPIGSGKTTFCSMLHTEMYNRGWAGEKFSYANRVKEIARMMGWDGVKDERGRELLQKLGTDTGRNYDQDMWVKYLIDKHIPGQDRYPFDIIFIDDWRFPNERDYIEKNPLYNLLTVRMVRDCSEDSKHISEISLPDHRLDTSYYDSVIYNTGDLYALQRSAVATSLYIISKYNKGAK